jgi:hypothetical protein
MITYSKKSWYAFSFNIITMALYRAAEKLSPLLRKKMKDRETVEEKDPLRKERSEYLERLEKACAGMTKSAKGYYETNKKINILLVSIGSSSISRLYCVCVVFWDKSMESFFRWSRYYLICNIIFYQTTTKHYKSIG